MPAGRSENSSARSRRLASSISPPYAMELNKTHAFATVDPTRGTRDTFGDGGQLSFTSEVQHFSGQHGAPSLDAIGHIGRNGFLFGHVDAAAATSDLRGIGRSGVGAHVFTRMPRPTRSELSWLVAS